jgi:sterol O-acyltransferase
MFPTIDYVDRVSHFDPDSDYHDFRGFFVLFWIGLAIMVITSMLRQVKETGYPFQIRQWNLFREKVFELGLVDGAMVGSTAVALPLQKLFLNGKGPLRWSQLGMAIQSIYQVIWLSFWCTYVGARNFTDQEAHSVQISLHSRLELDRSSLLHPALACHLHEDAFLRVSLPNERRVLVAHLLFSFYNGHLSETLRRLNDLDNPEKASKAAAVRYPKTRTHLHEIPQSPSQSEPDVANQESLRQLRADLAFELSSPLGRVSYPENLNVYNWVDYIFCPTLCYELEYPRVAYIRPLEVFYKALAVFGCIFLMVITTEEFILPVLDESAIALHHSKSALDFSLILAETIGRLLFPFMITFLLTFLVIFEYILGAFAEITCKS